MTRPTLRYVKGVFSGFGGFVAHDFTGHIGQCASESGAADRLVWS